MITLGLALHKNCRRCIDIHSADAERLGASEKQMGLVKKVALFMRASPHGNSNLWPDWVGNWRDYSFSRNI